MRNSTYYRAVFYSNQYVSESVRVRGRLYVGALACFVLVHFELHTAIMAVLRRHLCEGAD